MLDKLYHALLWMLGFAAGQHFSDMLARQKERFGVWWWVIAIVTIVVLDVFLVWLIVHVARFRLHNSRSQ